MQCLDTVAAVFIWYENNEIRAFAPAALRERQRLWKLFRCHFGADLVTECKPAQLIAFIASQQDCVSNHTRRRIRGTICRPFNAAVDAGLIARNPFRGVKIPKGKDGRDWTKPEFQAVLRHSAASFRRLVVFERFGGARPGEARKLEWSHIRDEVDAVVQREHKTQETSDEPRRIHFNGVIVKLLLWLRRHKTHATYVFTNKCRRPWTIRALCNHMAIVRERAGLPADVKNHGGRHTFGTNAILNGVDLATLAALMGHKSVKTTERYVHLLNKREHLNRAANRAIGR